MTTHAFGHAERVDRLRLIRSENVGPVTFRRLVQHFGGAKEALAALPELARRGGRHGNITISSRADAERELESLERLGARLVLWGEPDYPAPLAAIEDAPPALALTGHGHLLARRMIAVVGARNASANGRKLARQLAAELGRAGLVVVSGLARGIDAAAHEGALESGTAAVLAGGIDVVYPPENSALHERIAAEGVLLAEQPPGTVPQSRHFPHRNRIVSGLALGTIVVEAAFRSGSLITARHALEQGREVFAVPGSPLDPRARGANDLIRQGATLVESAEDALRVLDDLHRPPAAERRDDDYAAPAPALTEDQLAAARSKVLELLAPSPVQVDEVVRQCHMSPAVVSMVLLELELAGRLERHPGNQVSLV